MIRPIIALSAWLFAALVSGSVMRAAIAQAYPSGPLRIVVPYPPGGGTDILGRTIGQKLNERFGVPVVVDNRSGANGRPRAVNRVPACGMRTSASRDARR